MTEIEIETQTIDVESDISVASPSPLANVNNTAELELTVNKREFTITGDDIYIPQRYEEAPQWLRDLIGTVTSQALKNSLSEVGTLGDALEGLVAELNVAKNTYTQSIISDNSIDERINTAITTLNSTLADSDSTILDIALTRVTPEEVQTIVTGVLSASINNGDISASIKNLQIAVTDLDSARALDYQSLEAAISGESEATATAIQTISTYVGVDEAGASTGTGLSGYLEGTDGNIGTAGSELSNDIQLSATGVESKFEYNSLLNINGLNYNSGFGLVSSVTNTGTAPNPVVTGSEFWIRADKFRLITASQTGAVKHPFTVNGVTGDITFNGKVSFTNVTNTDSILQTGDAATDINTNTTLINGGKIVTNSITANQIQAGSISADRLSPSTGSGTVWENGGLVSQNFNGNPHGNIGTPTQGFRLSSDAAGTSTDPNMYGAYIKGSVVEATDVRSVSSYGKTGNMVYVHSGSIGAIIYGGNFGTGYYANRITTSQSRVVITAVGDVYIPEDTDAYFELQYYDSVTDTWSRIDQRYYRTGGGKLWTQVVFSNFITYAQVPLAGYKQTRLIISSETINVNVTLDNILITTVIYNQ